MHTLSKTDTGFVVHLEGYRNNEIQPFNGPDALQDASMLVNRLNGGSAGALHMIAHKLQPILELALGEMRKR